MTRDDSQDDFLDDEAFDNDVEVDDLEAEVGQIVADGDSADDAGSQTVRGSAPTVGLQTLPVTGEPRIDDALARLTDLASLPVDEHVGVFEDVQRRLHGTLADLSGQ